jgi:hypothetical protein
MQNEPMQNRVTQNRIMQKTTVICITQGRAWAGSPGFPQPSAAAAAWLSGNAKPAVRPVRRMKIVYRRDTNFVRRKAKFGIGLAGDGVV